jgi:hypothetical protein
MKDRKVYHIHTEWLFFLIILLVAISLIVIGPFIQIWAINTLFKTSVEYSWLSWFCMLILNSSFGAASYRGR